MINALVAEIYKALKSKLYFVALNTALTLPDICGKAEYPKLNTATRYKKWYQENIGQYEQSINLKLKSPCLNQDVVYSLRCNLLHQGTPNIKEKEINHFEINFSKNGIDRASSCIDSNGITIKTYSVNARRLCTILADTASNYYKNNTDKFNFFEYSILDENGKLIIGNGKL